MLRIESKFRNVIALVFISTMLTACGGGGGGEVIGTNPPPSGGGTNPPPAAKGSITLNWTAPATREDGKIFPLSEVGGYKVYLGNSPGNYNAPIDVGNTTTHTFSDLDPNTYYMAVSIYDINSQDSSRSGEVSAVIN